VGVVRRHAIVVIAQSNGSAEVSPASDEATMRIRFVLCWLAVRPVGSGRPGPGNIDVACVRIILHERIAVGIGVGEGGDVVVHRDIGDNAVIAVATIDKFTWPSEFGLRAVQQRRGEVGAGPLKSNFCITFSPPVSAALVSRKTTYA